MSSTAEQQPYKPVYYQLNRIPFSDDVRDDMRDDMRDNIKFVSNNYGDMGNPYNTNTYYTHGRLICVTYVRDGDDIINVYKFNDTECLQLVFTINMRLMFNDTDIYNVYVCTTDDANTFVLYWCIFTHAAIFSCSKIRFNEATHNIDCASGITNINKTCSILYLDRDIFVDLCEKYNCYIRRFFPIGSSLYICTKTWFAHDYGSGVISNCIIFKCMQQDLPCARIKFIPMLSLDCCYMWVRFVSPNILHIDNISANNSASLINTVYDINIDTGLITTHLINLPIAYNTYKSIPNPNAHQAAQPFTYFDIKGNCFILNCDTQILRYIEPKDNIVHYVTILSAFTSYGLKGIYSISDDCVCIKWNHGAHQMIYHFNRETYTLMPINIYDNSSISGCSLRYESCIPYKSGIYYMWHITDDMRDDIYTMLDEYLPPELCNMVWKYYVHISTKTLLR